MGKRKSDMTDADLRSHESTIERRNIERREIKSLLQLSHAPCNISLPLYRVELVVSVEHVDEVYGRIQALEDKDIHPMPRRRSKGDKAIPVVASASPWIKSLWEVTSLLKWMIGKDLAVEINLLAVSPGQRSAKPTLEEVLTVISESYKDAFVD